MVIETVVCPCRVGGIPDKCYGGGTHEKPLHAFVDCWADCICKGVGRIPVQKPRRAIEITITIGADTPRNVLDALNSIEFNIMEHGDDMNINSVSGGTSDSYEIHGSHKPEITHDMYFEQLNKYLGKEE